VLVAAAVCPHPPLLVPTVGAGLGPEIDALRQECTEVIDGLWAAGPDRLFVVGAAVGAVARSFAPWAPGSGAEQLVVDVPEPMPLPLLVGGFLTRGRPRSFVVVDPSTEPADCLDLGRDLAGAAERVALLVMGDGAARHDVKAPGYVDPRAADWDRGVHDIFRSGDLAALGSLDPALADELLCAGRAPWQVLAGAALAVAWRTEHATLAVPFGVGYHVAHWAGRAGNGATAAKG
jgi:hypothetical protein